VESSRHELDSDRSISAPSHRHPRPTRRLDISGERAGRKGRKAREAQGVGVRGKKNNAPLQFWPSIWLRFAR